MAKRKKQRRIPNTLKKLDLNKYSPQALEKRGLGDKMLRKIYSEFSSIAKKRIQALIDKGYGDTQEVRRSVFPTLKEVDTKPDPGYYLKAKIFELATFLNNPLSLLRNQSKRTEIKAQATLKEHGYDVAAKSYISFGKFMETIKSRGLGLMLDSKRAVQYYESHYLEGQTYKEIAQAFEEWQDRELKTIIENVKLLYDKDYKSHLQEMGIDYDAYKRHIADKSSRSKDADKARPKNSKSKKGKRK